MLINNDRDRDRSAAANNFGRFNNVSISQKQPQMQARDRPRFVESQYDDDEQKNYLIQVS